MGNLWRLYDDLIDNIPRSAQASDGIAGVSWTMVRSGRDGAGLAHSVLEASRPLQYTGSLQGIPLRELALCVKSWNLMEASLGLAAINAWYNTEERLNRLNAHWLPGPGQDIFPSLIERVLGKRVAIVGRLPNIERRLRPFCTLTVLTRDPQWEEYPESACEYLLPAQSFVFIAGQALITKALPRLLKAAEGAEVSLVGPSVSMASELLAHGIQYLSGYCVIDPDLTERAVRRGCKQGIYEGGKKVELNFLMG